MFGSKGIIPEVWQPLPLMKNEKKNADISNTWLGCIVTFAIICYMYCITRFTNCTIEYYNLVKILSVCVPEGNKNTWLQIVESVANIIV